MFARKPGEIRQRKRLSLHLYNRFMHKYFVQDLNSELQLRARNESADYVKACMGEAMMFRNRLEMLAAALAETTIDGLFLEFGVWKGDSLNFIARQLQARSRRIDGFDSFEGLPEEWSGTFERSGKFSHGGKLPKTPPNARLHPGWFSETLPRFLSENPLPVAFLHIDCDIYSSTKTVLDALAKRLHSGSVVVFD